MSRVPAKEEGVVSGLLSTFSFPAVRADKKLGANASPRARVGAMSKAREAVGIRQGPPEQMQSMLYKWTNYLSGKN